MNSFGKKFLAEIMFIMLISAICCSQDIDSDFQQALNMVPMEPKWPSGIMYYDMQEAAGSFINRHSGASAVEFLKTKIEDPTSRKLAILSLTKLATTNRTAEEILYNII
jgi:hypothetical protein